MVVRQAHGQLLAVDGVLAQQQPVVGVNFQGGDVVLRRVIEVADAALGRGAHKHGIRLRGASYPQRDVQVEEGGGGTAAAGGSHLRGSGGVCEY